MTASLITAPVEGGHRFISGSRLNLHKIGARMRTLWAAFLGGIDVFPGSCTAQNVVQLLQLRITPVAYFPSDFVYIRTTAARELKTSRALFYTENITAGSAE